MPKEARIVILWGSFRSWPRYEYEYSYTCGKTNWRARPTPRVRGVQIPFCLRYLRQKSPRRNPPNTLQHMTCFCHAKRKPTTYQPAPSTRVDPQSESSLVQHAVHARQYEYDRVSSHREQLVVDDEQFPGLHERVHLLLEDLKDNHVCECEDGKGEGGGHSIAAMYSMSCAAVVV